MPNNQALRPNRSHRRFLLIEMSAPAFKQPTCRDRQAFLRPKGGTPPSSQSFGLMAVHHGARRNPMRHQQENDAAFLRRLADDIRSLAEEAPEAADELRAISNEIDAEVQQQNEAALRRRDFSSSTRSLFARLATGS